MAELQKEGSDKADNGEGGRDKEPLRSCFSIAASIDELIVHDSFAASTPSNIPANIQREHSATTHAESEDPFPEVIEPKHRPAKR